MARPRYEPTDKDRATVKALAAYGVLQSEISKVIGVDDKTLRKHFRDELDTGSTRANAKVAESLFKRATGDGPSSVTAAIFWLKARAGWSEAKAEAPGKKEIEQEAAERVANKTLFAPRQGPRLAIDNS